MIACRTDASSIENMAVAFFFRIYRVQVSMAARWVANIIERRACWVAFALGAHPLRKADADGKGWQTNKQKWLFFLPQVEPEGGQGIPIHDWMNKKIKIAKIKIKIEN